MKFVEKQESFLENINHLCTRIRCWKVPVVASHV